jgi:DNA polymerase-3 subunit epsilon
MVSAQPRWFHLKHKETNMITMENLELERLAAQLSASNEYRVLRAVPAPTQRMMESTPPDGRCLALVDVETSSLDPADGAIIELAILLVWVDVAGNVLAHLGPWCWLNDPGAPLQREIIRLTGLTNRDLRGQAIDDEAASRLLDRADLIVAHNARFDVNWIDQRYPEHREKPWACSMADIDWAELGFEGRSQQHLLMQHGFFATGHRAAKDVWSLFHLLQQTAGAGAAGHHQPNPAPTHLQRLLAAIRAPSLRVEARRASISSKGLLKARGYRWDASPSRRVWWRVLREDQLAAEERWFARNFLPNPHVIELTPAQRHREL